MHIDVTSMLIGIALVMAAPVAIAALYNERHELAMIAEQIRDTVKELGNDQGRQNLRLELKYGRGYDTLKRRANIVNNKLQKSIEKEKKLKKSVDKSREASASLQKSAEQKPNSKVIAKMLNWRKAKTATLEIELANQKALVEDQKSEFQRIDEDCKILYVQKEAAIGKERQLFANDRINKLFAQTATSGHHELMNRMESKVSEKEKSAIEFWKVLDSSEHQKQSQQIQDLTAQIELKIQQFESKLTSAQEMLQNMDPSIERALERLKKRQTIAIKLAERSSAEEDQIEKRIAAKVAYAKTPQIDSEQQLLRAVRLRNLALQQRLFNVELIVKRLSLIQLVLTSIPDRSGDLAFHFQAISIAAQEHLKGALKTQSSPPKEDWDVPTRLSALECKTQLALIRSVKKILLDPPLAASPQALQNLTDALVTMRAEQKLQQPSLDKWKTLAKQSLEEGKELMHAIAIDRSRQHAEIIEIICQNTKVLNLALSCLQRNEKLE